MFVKHRTSQLESEGKLDVSFFCVFWTLTYLKRFFCTGTKNLSFSNLIRSFYRSELVYESQYTLPENNSILKEEKTISS